MPLIVHIDERDWRHETPIAPQTTLDLELDVEQRILSHHLRVLREGGKAIIGKCESNRVRRWTVGGHRQGRRQKN